MKQLYLKRIVFLVLCLINGLSGWALEYQSFIVNGIGYKILTDNTVAVTNRAQGPQQAIHIIPDYQDIPYAGDIVIPSTVFYGGITYTVTSILESTFENNTSVTAVTLPATVKEVGIWAFKGAGLKKLTVSDGNTALTLRHYSAYSYSSPFYGCPIDSLYIGRDINHANRKYDYAPYNSSLKDVVIGDQVTKISREAFESCKSLKKVSLGKNIEEIGESAFNGCDSLVSANLGDKVSSIGSYAFNSCKSLKTVNISDKVKIIQSYTFQGCISLESVTGFAAVDSIRSYAFYECKSLRNITIPATAKEVGIWAFREAGLKKLTVSDSGAPLTLRHNSAYSYSSPFYGCPIDSLYIGRDINHANRKYDYAPYNSSLKDVVIGDQVTKISREAFENCASLKEVSFGKNIEEIGASAFSGCNALQMIRAYWQIPLETPDNTFSNTVYKNATLYIPGGTMPAYQTTSCWKNFLKIQSMQYEVKVMATTGGKVRVNSSEAVTGTTQSYWIDSDAAVTFDFTAEEDYYLKSVTVNDNDVTDQIENGRFTIASLDGDVNVIATFVANAQYTVTASVVTLGSSGATEGSLDTLPYIVNGIGGFVTVSDSIVISGHSSTVTITPNEGYELKSVFVNGEDKTAEVVDSVLTLSNIQENKVVVVTFQKQRFSVTAAECEGGSISLSATEVEWGDSVTVIVTADEGYELASLIVGDEDITESVIGKKHVKCDISCVTKDIEVIATFRLESFTITTNCNEGGNIVLSNGTPEWGSDVTITVIPDKGYELVSVSIDGVDVTEDLTDGQYTIENVTADMTVEAVFRLITEVVITLTADGESTFCCDHDLDFSQTYDIRAYIASGYYPQTGYVLLTRVLEVPAGTGIVVRGEEGTYKIPFGNSSAYYLNLLVGNVEPVTVEPTEGDYANLCLTMGDNGLGFYPVTTSFVMEANRARLQLPTNVLGGESYVKIAYEEDADAVRAAKGTSEYDVFDLSGRQIVNGKLSNGKLPRGINILRMSDGMTRKVLVK